MMVGQSHPSGFIAAHSGFLELKLSNCQGRPTSRPTRRHVLCFFWQTLYIYIYISVFSCEGEAAAEADDLQTLH